MPVIFKQKNMFETEQKLLARISTGQNPEPMPGNFVPGHFTLRWHIIDRCNLKCPQCCIGDDPLPDLGLEKIYYMVENFVKTLKRMNIKGQVIITGGEPFMRREIFEFTGMIRSHKEYCSYGITCNGTLLDSEKAKKLAKYGCDFVEITLEGGKETNDSIRGEGAFSKALSAVSALKAQGVPVTVLFRAGRHNYTEMMKVAEAAAKAGAALFRTERVIHACSCSDAPPLMNSDETAEYFMMLNSLRKKYEKKMFSKMSVSMTGALQFMFYNGDGPERIPYTCTAGRTSLTVLADGRLVPCYGMPVIIGDFKTDDLYEIYSKSALLQMLRNPRNIPAGCESCKYSAVCNGGLKCLSYAVHGNPFIRDPGCTDDLLEKSMKKP